MDWSRAKNIILVLLIFLNIFLFINIINVKKSFELSGAYRANALKALNDSGIVIDCTIPFNNKPVQRISFIENDNTVYTEMIRRLTGINDENEIIPGKDYYFYNNGKTLKLSENGFVFTDDTQSVILPAENRKKLDKALKAWIKKNRISQQNFILDSLYQEGDTVIAEYVQLYKKMPVFSNRIIFRIKNKYLAEVEGSNRIFYSLKANKEDYVVSPEIVLLTNKDKISGEVESIDLGYFLAQEDELYDTPVWRIKLSSGKEELFNAFTGEWINLG